jgi:molecular chaperone DnaK
MPERTVAEVKRLMGSTEKVKLGDRVYSPTEISAVILRALKEDAERFFGGSVEEAVVTVPAYFTDAQRQATKDAGELAGLRVERILNEPTAAALAYGIDNLDKEQHVVVYDLGGGTFDVSVLEMFDGVLDVKASAGNNRLGGGDFDRALCARLCDEIERAHGVDVRGDAKAMARIRAAAEQAKTELSSIDTAQVMLPFIAAKAGAPISFEAEITRAELEALVGPLVRSTLAPLEAALADARIDRRAVAEVVLVGGASRMPMVQALVAEFFGKEPRRGVNPDEAIALGAAVQAGLKTGAISAHGGIMITDVCPFTLGVEVMGSAGSQKLAGIFSPIIPRNSTVPVAKTEVYSTTAEGQRQVEIKVFQGESRLVKNNVYLDQYSVDGVPPGPAGSEKVAVTFTYDINGILKVTTKIVSTGKEASLTVDKSPARMSSADRVAAKDRLDRELGAAPVVMEPQAASKPDVRRAQEVPAARGKVGSSSAAASSESTAALVAAAKAKLASVKGEPATKLADLLTALEKAAAAGDSESAARIDVELTELLFELD